jgi:hydroxymethylbilane synthase
MRNRRIILGSRGSKLARVQATIIAERLRKLFPDREIVTEFIVTSGDRDQKSQLAEIGGKGIFIRELEQALLAGSIDIAVHSFKDVTSNLAPSLVLAGFRTPESVCDVLITRSGGIMDALPHGAVIGTGSMRRQVLLQRLRPDLSVAALRGNIDTRLAKVESGSYDGIMLSEAGLIRLGLEQRISERFDPDTFYPAPGQGVITLETREDDAEMVAVARAAGDQSQYALSVAELSLLTTIGFDCRTPLGVHTVGENGIVTMRGFFVDESSGQFIEQTAQGPERDPAAVGKMMADLLLGGTTK